MSNFLILIHEIFKKKERALILDSMGQLAASILSKKIAAGSSHVIIDVPIGSTVKVRTIESANILKNYLERISKSLSIEVKTIFTDGTQFVGPGIGPSLEAKDVLAVLQGDVELPSWLVHHRQKQQELNYSLPSEQK